MSKGPQIEYTLVYSHAGEHSHLLCLNDTVRWGETLCTATSAAVEEANNRTWLGTGSQEEIDRALKLPLCKICAKKADKRYLPEGVKIA